MTGASIILVEDEALIRLMLADMIEELGHRVVAEAGNIQVGQALAQAAIFDLAVLDINIAGYSMPDRRDHRRAGPAVFLCHRLWASRPTRSVQNTPGASEADPDIETRRGNKLDPVDFNRIGRLRVADGPTWRRGRLDFSGPRAERTCRQ